MKYVECLLQDLAHVDYLEKIKVQQMNWIGKTDGLNKYILWGLVVLTLMFTFYAVVGLISATFGIRIGIPQFFGGQDTLSPGSGNIQRSYSVIR
jgi:hypothetical protein